MISRWILIVFGLAVLGGAVAFATVYTWVHQERLDVASEPVLFTVNAGEPFMRVVNRLAQADLMGHPRAVVAYGMLRGYDRRIKTGTYSVAAGESAQDILERFVAGDVHKITFTIPEGFMHNEIARTVALALDIDSTSVADAVADTTIMAAFGIEAPSLEGYLFPDTYHLPWGSDATTVVTAMVRGLDRVFGPTLQARAREIGMSRNEILTLASIIEAECRLLEEQATVSAVYHNRLRRNMRLEADPTVAYAKGMYRGRLFYKDLEIDSPYNTYKYAGLPPGPICSPGAGAIHASLYPDSTTTALYFVARGDGGHVFSNTLKEHLTEVKAHRKRRAAERIAQSGR